MEVPKPEVTSKKDTTKASDDKTSKISSANAVDDIPYTFAGRQRWLEHTPEVVCTNVEKRCSLDCEFIKLCKHV